MNFAGGPSLDCSWREPASCHCRAPTPAAVRQAGGSALGKEAPGPVLDSPTRQRFSRRTVRPAKSLWPHGSPGRCPGLGELPGLRPENQRRRRAGGGQCRAAARGQMRGRSSSSPKGLYSTAIRATPWGTGENTIPSPERARQSGACAGLVTPFQRPGPGVAVSAGRCHRLMNPSLSGQRATLFRQRLPDIGDRTHVGVDSPTTERFHFSR